MHLFGANLFFSPAGKVVVVLNGQAKTRVVQSTQSRGKAGEACLRSVGDTWTAVAGLGHRTKRLLRERRQANSPRVLRTRHVQATGACSSMVTRPRRASGDVQVPVGGRFVLMHRGFDAAAVGELIRAGTVVQWLRGRRLGLRLGLQSRQGHRVVQSVLLLLCLLSGHLVQVHGQRVASTRVQHSRWRRHCLQRVALSILRAGRARCWRQCRVRGAGLRARLAEVLVEAVERWRWRWRTVNAGSIAVRLRAGLARWVSTAILAKVDLEPTVLFAVAHAFNGFDGVGNVGEVNEGTALLAERVDELNLSVFREVLAEAVLRPGFVQVANIHITRGTTANSQGDGRRERTGVLAPADLQPTVMDHQALQVTQGVEGSGGGRIDEGNEADVLVGNVTNVV